MFKKRLIGCAMGDLAEDVMLAVGAKAETGGSEEVAPCRRATIGTDGARDLRSGSDIGSAQGSGRVRFRGPCIDRVRGMEYTCVRSWAPRLLGLSRNPSTQEAEITKDVAPAPLTFDREVVQVRIHVADGRVPEAVPHEEVAVAPDVTYAEPTPNITDAKALSLDEDDRSLCRANDTGRLIPRMKMCVDN